MDERATPDLDRIDALIDWAETSHINGDGEWNQWDYFFCGTSFCIAGKVVVEEGLFDVRGKQLVGDKHMSPGEAACDILDLEPWSSGGPCVHPLFWDYNTIDDLRRVAKDLRNEHGASS